MVHESLIAASTLPATTRQFQFGRWRMRPSIAADRWAPHLGEHVSDANQMVIEYLLGYIEQLENSGIPHRVVDVQSLLAPNHNIARAQDGKLLGKSALLDLKKAAEFVDPEFSVAQGIQDGNPQWVRQGFEELCLKSPQFGHQPSKSLILYIVKLGKRLFRIL
jgi:hypothetical protein